MKIKEGDVIMKKLISVLLIIAIIFTCSGCSLDFFSVDSLIFPPTQSGKNGEVQKAFNNLMKDTKVQLKTPVAGEFQTSFVLKDVNNDEIEEAFVFYSDSSSVDSSVRVAFLECVDDEWCIVSDIKGAGNGVYDINFVDLNRDGMLEIFVTWSLLDSKTSQIVSVFTISSVEKDVYTLDSLGNEYCNAKSFLDFNGDGLKDLVLIYLDDTSTVQKSYLRMFTLTKSRQLEKYGETVLDSAISSISKIQSDVCNLNNKPLTRLFVDCVKNDRMIFTEMVYWDAVHKVPVKEFTEPSVSNLRNSILTCKDIDNDGLLEVPSSTKLYGDEKTFNIKTDTDIYTLSLLIWNNVKGDDSVDAFTTLLNPFDYYLLHFNWGNKVTVKYDSLREALLFYKWNEEAKRAEKELFSIAYRKKLAENEILGDLLAETEKGVYYYQITEAGYSFGITDETLSSFFIKID